MTQTGSGRRQESLAVHAHTLASETGGVARLAAAFQRARSAGRAALMPYITAGFPSLDVLGDVLEAVAAGGADAVEVGVPFSDPLADGPLLQAASTMALGAGFRLPAFFERLAGALEGYAPPVALLCYVNPILAHGPRRFVAEAAAAGVSGIIVPDLPLAEAGALRALVDAAGMALIPMATPNSSPAHLERVARGRGFVYGVSVTGVTGVRETVAPGVLTFAARLKQAVGSLPVAIGFGISTPDHAREVGRVADGVIVGTALVRAQMADPAAAAPASRRFVASLRAALDEASGGRGA
jgi:tryptophan synthase alpha chain